MGDARGERELTLRAVLVGCLLGALLAAANVYTGLKTAVVDGGNITAAVLAFALFSALRARPLLGVLENNVVQTIAGSAAMMAMVTGVVGPVPALALAGHEPAVGVLVLWALGLALLGIMLGLLLRGLLIDAQGLPFPTGAATAEVIEALAGDRGTAARRARALLVAALLAGLLTLLRDGPWAWLPASLLLPGTLAGVSLASLSIGFSVSPLLLGTGVLVGLRTSLAMLLGSLVAWALLAPRLLSLRLVSDLRYEQFVTWLVWPGAALMLASSLTSLGLSSGALLRGIRDLSRLRPAHGGPGRRFRWYWLALALVSSGLVLTVACAHFGLSPAMALGALALSCVLSVACARSAGETDVAPVGAMGGVAQLACGGSGTVASLACGALVAGQASQTAATLWALKAGARLGASVRSQALAQLVGALVGALVAVPTYAVVVRAYGLGSERMPAPGALSWKATADAVQGGFAALPAYAGSAALVGLGLGVLLTLLERTRFGSFVPSPVALGIGLILPASLSATVALGAAVWWLLARRFAAWSAEHGAALAGGAIAGESLLAVLLAVLLASGVITL